MIERNIITFLTLVEEENTVRCAERLHITQPAVTQHIHSLEEEYGIKLFLKEGRRLMLTEKGKEFYKMAHRLYTLEKQIEFRIKTYPNIPIRFGVTRSINEGVMPYITAEFIEKYPNRPVEMTVQNTKTLLEKLEEGAIDFALIEGNFDHNKYECSPFMDADFVGLCKKGGKYSNFKSILDVFKAPLILREQGSGSRDIFEKVLAARGYDLSNFGKVYQFESMPVLLELVKNDFGITFAYKQAAKKEIESGEISVMAESILNLHRQFYFVTLPSSAYLDETLEMFKFLQSLANKNLNKQ